MLRRNRFELCLTGRQLGVHKGDQLVVLAGRELSLAQPDFAHEGSVLQHKAPKVGNFDSSDLNEGLRIAQEVLLEPLLGVANDVHVGKVVGNFPTKQVGLIENSGGAQVILGGHHEPCL